MQSPDHAGRAQAAHEVDWRQKIDARQEVDLRALGQALRRRRRTIVVPTLVAFVAVAIFVNVVTPRYTAESQVLLENQETFFTRPDRVNLPPEQALQVDQEGVASQVQLIGSRDIARRAIKKLGLAGDPEFDPLAAGVNPLSRVLILLGIVPDPTRESAESRMVTKFLEKLSVFSPTKTRVITIQFSSRNAELAARAANTVAQLYLQEQSAAKRATAKIAAEALSTQIGDLRTRLAQADAEREQYRLQSGLLSGTNNMTISGQQLADLNTDLSKARATQADAQAKAEMIRELIREGKSANVADVINNDIVRRVSDQRFAAQAQLGREARTLLAGHPRIKELQAQLGEYDAALKSAAKQAATSLENEAKIAGQRVINLETALNQQKKQAGVANADEVKLRALDRYAQSLKDQLDSSTAKYQEALARQASTATPADARIISSATRPQEPSFPKKLPYVLFGTAAALILSIGFVLATELLGAPGDRAPVEARKVPDEAGTARHPEPGHEPDLPPSFGQRRSRAFDKPEEDALPDPAFGPIERKAATRPSVETLRGLTSGGLLAGAVSYLKGFGRSAEDSRGDVPPMAEQRIGMHSGFGWDEHDGDLGNGAADRDAAVTAPAVESPSIEDLLDKIVAAHVPGRGLQLVASPLGKAQPGILIEMGRSLSIKGRTIVVDLNRLPNALAVLVDAEEGARKIAAMHGLAELLSGESTFAEVIRRDQASRLHFIPTGAQDADFRDFDLILDALSETYDFIILLTPDVASSEIAKIMAPYAEFVVLSTRGADDALLDEIEKELIRAGAREILVAGAPSRRSLEVA